MSDDSRSGYRDALVELFLIASPGVVRAVAAFHDHMLLPAALRESEQQQQLLADVYHSMRADCFEMDRWSWSKEAVSRRPRSLTREDMKRMLPSWEWSRLEEVDLGDATIEEAELAPGQDGSDHPS